MRRRHRPLEVGRLCIPCRRMGSGGPHCCVGPQRIHPCPQHQPPRHWLCSGVGCSACPVCHQSVVASFSIVPFRQCLFVAHPASAWFGIGWDFDVPICGAVLGVQSPGLGTFFICLVVSFFSKLHMAGLACLGSLDGSLHASCFKEKL